MQCTSSVAQGTFLFLPEGFSLSKFKKSRKRKLNEISLHKWEVAYGKIWKVINQQIKEINESLYSKVLEDLIEHLKKLDGNDKFNGVIPCEILLTGTNLPDHTFLLSTLVNGINSKVTPYVASLWSWNCGNIKSTIQCLVSQILDGYNHRLKNEEEDDDDDDNNDMEDDNSDENLETGEDDNLNSLDNSTSDINTKKNLKITKSQYNLSTLSSWYKAQLKCNETKKPVIVIVPDFESFLPTVLGELILLLSSYSLEIPFILVFGVATTAEAVYRNLPQKVLSQIVIQLFRSERSTSLLNNIIENVFFSEGCPFRLGKKCMVFLMDMFLFHSFSVHDFIQGFKYCLMEHFFKHNHFTLCCSSNDVAKEANLLSDEEVDNIRKLPSYQNFVASRAKDERKLLLLNKKYTQETVTKLVEQVLDHTRCFHIALKMAYKLTNELPKSPLGRNLREYYCSSVSSKITDCEGYGECMKLLELQSQSELISKLDGLIEILNSSFTSEALLLEKNKKLNEVLLKFNQFKQLLMNCEKKIVCKKEGNKEEEEEEEETKTKNKEDDKVEKESENTSSFQDLKKDLLNYVKEEIFGNLLKPPTELPLQEIIYFDDITAIRRRISGSPRGAIHLALNNPQCYLNCKCCVLSNSESVLPTLPDLSIAYKIHLEHNKIINMYDWLQSFATVVDQGGSANEKEVNQEIQARFTRAVSELQFLGFIKPSRAKADHVTRLTWGNT